VFSKNAKRKFIIGQLLLLTAVFASMFLPRSGFTFDGGKQIELAVKKPAQSGMNHSALWVTNLGVNNTKLTVGTKPLDSAMAQERLYASELIAGGKTVRLDDSLPATFRGSDTLFIRSPEEVATLVAPVDFPVNSSEFYSSALPQQDGRFQAGPKWVSELRAVGKSGKNVFNADDVGYAPAVKGQREVDKRYAFGVGVALTKGNSSAEFKLISRAGQTIKSLVLSSSSEVYWQAPLGQFISGTDHFPNRIEMKVLAGTAQGFLSIKDSESEEMIPLPIVPFAGQGSLQGQADDGEAVTGEKSSLSAQSGRGGPMLDEESSPPAQSCFGGYAYFSNSFHDGVYDCGYTSYTYNVYNAPPNVCGTLHIVRNGVEETTPGWICTDAQGQATKGPWTPSTNQTGQGIYIEWPCGGTTSGGDYKVDDVSPPVIWPNQTGGVGAPIPTEFTGWGTDTQWGSGFNFFDWSSLPTWFQNTTTSKYYDGAGYYSDTPRYFYGTASPPAGGFSIIWGVAPPPPAAHNSYDNYVWCVVGNDKCYGNSVCVPFYAPR